MPISNMRADIHGDGTVNCYGRGMQCHVLVEVQPAITRTSAHDDELQRLTKAYNALIRPFLKPRVDVDY